MGRRSRLVKVSDAELALLLGDSGPTYHAQQSGEVDRHSRVQVSEEQLSQVSQSLRPAISPRVTASLSALRVASPKKTTAQLYGASEREFRALERAEKRKAVTQIQGKSTSAIAAQVLKLSFGV